MREIKKDEEYTDIPEPIIFEGKKLIILDTNLSSPVKILIILNLIVYPVIFLSCYKIYLAISSFSFIQSVFWLFILSYTLRLRLGIQSNKEYIIDRISIFEDGKTCEINTMTDKFTIDINRIRKLNLEEAIFMAEKLESIKVNYIPIVIDTKLYLIPIQSIVGRKDILGFVCEGKYLKFSEIIHKDRTIQI